MVGWPAEAATSAIPFPIAPERILPITMPVTFPRGQLLAVNPGLFPYLVSQKPTVLPVGWIIPPINR